MMHTKKSGLVMVAAFLAAAFAACGEDSPTDPAGDPGGTPRTIKAAPSFATDINEILQRRGCSTSGCHGTGAGGLTLSSSASANYAALVGVTANGQSIDYVVPNDATNSYLVIKIEGRQTVGQQMPLGSSALDNIDQTNIRNWIDTGAPNN